MNEDLDKAGELLYEEEVEDICDADGTVLEEGYLVEVIDTAGPGPARVIEWWTFNPEEDDHMGWVKVQDPKGDVEQYMLYDGGLGRVFAPYLRAYEEPELPGGFKVGDRVVHYSGLVGTVVGPSISHGGDIRVHWDSHRDNQRHALIGKDVNTLSTNIKLDEDEKEVQVTNAVGVPKRIRNYSAMLDDKLIRCYKQLYEGTGEAYRRCLDTGSGDPGRDCAKCEEELLARGYEVDGPLVR